MKDFTAILEALEAAKADALASYRKNQADKAPIESTSFDAGRYEGLKQALEILDRIN